MTNKRQENIEAFLEYKITIERYVVSTVEKSLKKYSLTKTQAQIIHLIYRSKKEITTTELAKRFNVTKGAITQLIDKLQERNFIQSRRDEADRRKYYIDLTKEGLDFFESMRQKGIKKLDLLFTEITDEELNTITNVFRKIHNKLHKTI